MGCYAAGFRVEHQYHYNQFQYNIGLNNPYGVMQYSLYTAIYPIMGNIFKHATYSIVMDISAYAGQFGPWIKNKFNDIQYRQISSAMSRQIFQDIEITYASDATNSTYDSDYSNSDMRGTTGAVILVNKDYIRGNFQLHSMGGWYDKDETIHMGNGWSYKGTVNRSDRDLRISQMVYVKYGVPVTVTAYMRKNAAYNGLRQPHIMVQGRLLPYQVQEMANINDQWVKVELTFTPARSEMIEIAVGGRGTAGNFWIDPRVKVTTFDLDLIQGPYSTNLMFGLEEIYADAPNVILGGTTLG
jgi:hypothetical protein